jgi:hypothetical protein
MAHLTIASALRDRNGNSRSAHIESDKNGRVHMARLPCLRLCAVIRLNPRIVACQEAGRLAGSAANIGSRVEFSMWSFLIRGSVSVVVLATLWLLTAQSFSLLIDRVYTVPLATLPSTPLGWNGTYLQFGSSVEGTEEPKGGWSSVEFQTGSRIVDLEGPGPSYHQIATLTVTDDKLVLSAGGQRLALGSRAGTLSGADGPIPAFAAEPRR